MLRVAVQSLDSRQYMLRDDDRLQLNLESKTQTANIICKYCNPHASFHFAFTTFFKLRHVPFLPHPHQVCPTHIRGLKTNTSVYLKMHFLSSFNYFGNCC